MNLGMPVLSVIRFLSRVLRFSKTNMSEMSENLCKMRCAIFGAAKIQNYRRIKSLLLPDDFNIFCDGGLSHSKKLGIEPNLVAGDFDSLKNPGLAKKKISAETLVLPREKDDTDSFFAVKEGFRRGFRDFFLAGTAGDRFDHTFANVSALLWLFNRGCRAVMADDFSTMKIVGSEGTFVDGGCRYFSLLPVFGDVFGVEISDAKFPLKKGSVSSEYVYTTSNENLPGKQAFVRVEKGLVLLVEVFAE